MVRPEIIALLGEESAFISSPIHGISHWETVERNGHYLADFTGADKEVISYFAYFHDCMRENDRRDPEHGLRAAQFAAKHRELIDLTELQFEQLIDACQGHTNAERPDCVTINTCWDADRLDLGRIGLPPNSEFLHSIEAKRIADTNDFAILQKET
jgi:uncharacterized protein